VLRALPLGTPLEDVERFLKQHLSIYWIEKIESNALVSVHFVIDSIESAQRSIFGLSTAMLAERFGGTPVISFDPSYIELRYIRANVSDRYLVNPIVLVFVPTRQVPMSGLEHEA
jgi:hypothetical protein